MNVLTETKELSTNLDYLNYLYVQYYLCTQFFEHFFKSKNENNQQINNICSISRKNIFKSML